VNDPAAIGYLLVRRVYAGIADRFRQRQPTNDLGGGSGAAR